MVNFFVQCQSLNWTLSEYQSYGYDIGSVVQDLPTISEIINMGKKVLGISK